MKNTLRVCTIGGGSGMPIVNNALVKAGFLNIKSIVTTFDNGGDTGRMRTDERGKILAFSDYWRSLISLWNDGEQKAIWEEMLKYRDGRDRNFGNMFFQFMSEKTGNLSNVDSLFSKLTGADLKGEVVPISLEPSQICFKTLSGNRYRGEHHMDDLRMSLDRIIDIWLEPQVKANKEALEVLEESEIIIVCPGSLYGSVLTNFLPIGIKEAYKKSKAKKILMTNIMSVANENNGFNQEDYAELLSEFINDRKAVDLILMADVNFLDMDLLDMTYKNYANEHSFPIKFKETCKFKTILADLAIIDKSHLRLRHSEDKLAEYLKDVD